VNASSAAFIALALLLGGCGGNSGKPPPASSTAPAAASGALKPSGGGFFSNLLGSTAQVSCPRVTKIAEASQLTRFSPAGHDLTDVLFEAKMGDINGTCSISDNAVHVQMTADFIAALGPADKTHKAPFSYFVAITDIHDKILVRQQFDTSIDFPGNTTRAGIREDLEQVIPLGQAQRGDDFHIYLGFVVTHEEADYNRAHPQ